MKKLLLAASVAAASLAPVAAMAETTLYGNFRYTVATIDVNGVDVAGITGADNASRIGIKGSVGEKDKLTGFYHLQMAAHNQRLGGGNRALSSRFYHAGVKGGFGTLLIGRTSTPYKMAGLRIDPFYDTSAGVGHSGANYGFSSLTNGWFDNTVAYITPTIAGGLTANLAVVVDPAATDEHGINVGAVWSSNGLTVGAQLLDAANFPGVLTEGTRIHAGYKASGWSVGVNAETVDVAPLSGDFLNVSGTLNLGSGVVAASYGTVDGNLGTSGQNGAGTGYTLGYFHNLAKKTQVGALYSTTDFDGGSTADQDTIGVMLVQSF